MQTTPDFSSLAECFDVRESVIENLFEEYERELEAFNFELSFMNTLSRSLLKLPTWSLP